MLLLSNLQKLSPSRPAPSQLTLLWKFYNPNKPVETVATFDFSSEDGLKAIFGSDFSTPASGAGYNITEPFTKDDVTITATKNSSSGPRIWNTSGKLTFRTYKGDSFTIAAPATYYIKKIEINADKPANVSNSNYASGVWEAAENAKESEVAFSVTNTIQINTITVTIGAKDQETGVEVIEAEEGDAEYFNLQGVRVQNPERGIYIKIANGKASKVLVK